MRSVAAAAALLVLVVVHGPIFVFVNARQGLVFPPISAPQPFISSVSPALNAFSPGLISWIYYSIQCFR